MHSREDVRYMLRSPLIGGRLDFARVCNDRKYQIAVEVGTDRGVFARQFLDVWHGEMLYCVDAYRPTPDMPWERSGDHFQTVLNLQPHGTRYRLLIAASEEASHYFGNLHDFPVHADFVYIDAAHDYLSVTSDLKRWWEVVRPGGMLAGDDYGEVNPGVKRAVDDFVQVKGLKLQLTTDYNREPSWFLEKHL